MSSITGLGLRNKALGRSSDSSSSKSKPAGSISGLGLRNKVGLGKDSSSSSSSSASKSQGSSITGLGLRNKAGLHGSKSTAEHDISDRVSTPRAALIDPSSFAPPPKNINYHNAAAGERQIGRIQQKGPLTPAEYQAREKERLDQVKEEEAMEREQRRLDREEALYQKQQRRLEQEARQSARLAREGGHAGPTLPSISQQVPKQIMSAQQEDDDIGPPLPTRNYSSDSSSIQGPPPIPRNTRPGNAPKANALPPHLPPRLPARQNSSVDTVNSSISSRGQSPVRHEEQPTSRGPTAPSPRPLTTSENPQLSELQARFARMKPTSEAEVKAPGNSWTGQSALASTSNNAGVQVAKKWKTVETGNRRFGQTENREDEEMGSPIDMRDNTVLPVKKAPPPIPKKRAGLPL